MRDHPEEQSRARAEDIALFRYALVREPADDKLSKAERGALVRSLAASTHRGPDGDPVSVSRPTIDRWIRAYRAGGFSALSPRPRRIEARTPAGLLALACDLRREDPARSAAHIAAMLAESQGHSPHPRTLQRHFRALGLTRAALSGSSAAFGRFEATYPNELWVGDALHGPVVGAKKAILFCFVDDHSRLVTGHRWTYAEDTLSAESALRRGILSRGLPATVYLDNGSSFVSKQLLRALAVLGVRLVHSRPGRPQGRGKIERFFRTVREQFLIRSRPFGDSHPGGARGALCGLGGAGLSPPGAFRDRPDATSALQRARCAPDSPDGPCARGVPLPRDQGGHQAGDGVAVWEPLRGRPGTDRAARRSSL